MINPWRGTAYIPKVKLEVLLKTLQEPQSDKHKQEDVISSRVVATGEQAQKLYLHCGARNSSRWSTTPITTPPIVAWRLTAA